MADRYDPIPDLAALVAASVYMDGIPAAYRIASKLRITPETGFKEIEARLRKAMERTTEDQPPTLADRVTEILSAAGYTDTRRVSPGGFIVTEGPGWVTTGWLVVSVPWTDASDGERARRLGLMAAELRAHRLEVCELERHLQVRERPGVPDAG